MVWAMMVTVVREVVMVLWSVVLQVMAFLGKWREVMVCLMVVFFSVMMLVLIMLVMEMTVLTSIWVMRVHIMVMWESFHVRVSPAMVTHFWKQLS